MYARRRLGQYETTAEAAAAALPASTPSTAAEFWGKAVGTVVGTAAQILEATRKPATPPYFAPPPRLAVALPTAAPAGLPGWLLPVGLVAAAGGAALWLMTQRR